MLNGLQIPDVAGATEQMIRDAGDRHKIKERYAKILSVVH